MFFNNLQIYRLPKNWNIEAIDISRDLAPHAFQPCTSLDIKSQGWVSPRDNGDLVYVVNKQILITMGTESKLLPTSVINQVMRIKAAEIEEQQGFKPGRKQMKEIKEEVTDELLPRAFSTWRKTHVWIDPVNGWLVVDASTSSKADEILRLLIKSIDKFPMEALHVVTSPVAAMTSWLLTDEAPIGFTVDQDTELRSNSEGKATVRYVHHTLESEDVSRHINGGKQCTRLAMTWADKISFTLTESLAIKKVRPLDVIKENATAQNDDERFDGDWCLFTGEVSRMLDDLIDALGGEIEKK